MKAIRSVNFNFFLAAILFAGTAAFAQTDETSSAQQLVALEKRLTDSEAREKQILENQTKILEELHRIAVLIRRN